MPLSGGEICVGSDPSVQIPVRADLGLLPRHFAVAQREGGWYIGAYAGAALWVNGRQVSMTELHDGDHIVAGQLELTYWDEQPAVTAAALQPSVAVPAAATPGMPVVSPSNVPQTWAPLRLDDSASHGGIGAAADSDSEEGGSTLARSSYPPPARIPARPPVAEERQASDRYNPQKWGALKMGAIGLAVTVAGLFACYVSMFELPGPLKPQDLVIKEAHIISAIRHHRRKGASWTEIKLAPAMQRVIELPDDLVVSPSWQGAFAKIGFVKKYHDDTHLNMLGAQVPLRVATLEIDGKSYRSLTKHNTVQEGENQLITLAAPCMVFGGVFLLILAWEKRKK